MRRRRRLALALVLAAARAGASAQEAAASAPEVDAGRKIYISSCQRCHGINLATNGIGFDLRTFPQAERERFVRSVTDGLRAMPAWGNTMKPEQIELIWGYIGSVNGWTATPASQ
jgi:cytochrome c55X